MKIRSEFIKANRAIRQIAKECGANPVYVWDIAADEFNIIKGCGCVSVKCSAEHKSYQSRKETFLK